MSDAAPPVHEIDPSAIPHDALKIIRRLDRNGFKAYLVGGCVRDLLAGLSPKDFDLATNARPRQIKRLFRNSRIIGRRFRLVHVRFGHHVYEVSTFRAPPQPEDNGDDDDPYIRQDNVYGTEEQDAFRRDFTINALFYDPIRRKIIDHVGGVADLEARRLRIIGDAETRIREDPVRILRAARFAGKLALELTDDLTAASRAHVADLTKAAPPRVLEEFYKLLSGRGAVRTFRILDALGALDVLAPELSPLPDSFYEALAGLEEVGRGDRGNLTQSLMAAVLFAPLALPVLRNTGLHDVEAAVNDVIRPVGVRLTVSRRDMVIARQCLAAQVRLGRPPRGRTCKRFARRDYFKEALQLRRLLGPVVEAETDPLPLWEGLANEAPPAQRQPRKKRRRRGRRGGRRLRRRQEGGKDEACPPSASSSAPAPPPPPKPSPPDSSNGDSSPA